MLTTTRDCRAFKVRFGLHMHPLDLRGSSTICALLSLRDYVPYSRAFATVPPYKLRTKQSIQQVISRQFFSFQGGTEPEQYSANQVCVSLGFYGRIFYLGVTL